jgi:hypothetical protein
MPPAYRIRWLSGGKAGEEAAKSRKFEVELAAFARANRDAMTPEEVHAEVSRRRTAVEEEKQSRLHELRQRELENRKDPVKVGST